MEMGNDEVTDGSLWQDENGDDEDEEPEASTPAPVMVPVTFSVKCEKTRWGEAVGILGSCSALHEWRQTEPLMLSAGSAYPTWTLTVSIPSGTPYEYKYLICRPDGSIKTWEADNVRPIVNRRAIAPRDSAEVREDGLFGEIPGVMPIRFPGRDRDRDRERRRAERERERGSNGGEERHRWELTLRDGSTGVVEVPHRRGRVGKGRQASCYRVQLTSKTVTGEGIVETSREVVIKEFKGGKNGRLFYSNEEGALRRLNGLELSDEPSNGTAASSSSSSPPLSPPPHLTTGSSGSPPSCIPEFIGSDRSRKCALMNFHPGQTLLSLGPPADKRLAFSWWFDLCEGVVWANGLHVYHCDVNPSNLLVLTDPPLSSSSSSWSGPTASCPPVLLVDWANGRLAASDSSKTTQSRRGHFQGPEIMMGRVGDRTDVFGVTGTLLWMLTGRHPRVPVDSDENVEWLCRVLAECLGEGVGDLDRLAAVIGRGVACEWTERTETIAEVQQGVREWFDEHGQGLAALV
ncbi:unnamed protein product [Vitrella brassicaformis CCMP3155]|uniref:CBM20 domain-containing protein n=1 Tax=Vitrella brassicaformis (strain CCMP3155) TaxID=1169540 RepID=A0A0G4FJ13_VITBC|nr:unnamed protein product [Vitrella brassicaformis CCMP3155]|mmetsp:Transcript_39730/g.113268  ORF Transcript_39730/g.113268 Transcript_39730/m.113268 type:complete len:518 (+) Transcript_39730:110-1663(+)|eukprot:CEM13754.1 unnamed protein product [Vitrella brassicaformis CCMP3155]